MEVLRPFRYWKLRMSKRLTVTLHHVITVYNAMFNHMNGVMRALAKKKTQWKEDLYYAVKFVQQKLSNYYTEVTPTTGMLLRSAHIIDLFRKLRSFRKWDKVMDINPEGVTSYITQYQEAFLKYVENAHCAEHISSPVTKPKRVLNNHPVSSSMACRSGQSLYDRNDLSSIDEGY